MLGSTTASHYNTLARRKGIAMSAFIVSESTMNKAVAGMVREGRFIASEALDQLGRDLYAMNQKAVYYRYDETEDVPEFRYQLREYNRGEMLKAMHGLRYQCSEGDVPETWPLYKQLTESIHALEHEIACEQPEYKAADWD